MQQWKKAEHRKGVRFFGLTLAGSQSVLFVLMSAIFPIVSKTCLYRSGAAGRACRSGSVGIGAPRPRAYGVIGALGVLGTQGTPGI